MRIRVSDLARFLNHVSIDWTTECWNWTGAKNEHGYGQFSIPRTVEEKDRQNGTGYKRVRAHVFCALVFLTSTGTIEKGLQVDHMCGNTSCVNPNHLQVISAVENNKLGGKPHFKTILGDGNILVNSLQFKREQCLL